MAGYNARVASQQLSTSASNGRSELPLFSLAADSSLTTCSRADAGAWTNYPFLTRKERDNETGLDYFGARYYSSVQGRFTSVDIAGPDLINPQSLNKYAYTLNNPLRYVDPKGLYEVDVHLQLTYALGLAAGFTSRDAWNIALGDQGVDDDPNRSPYAGVEARRN